MCAIVSSIPSRHNPNEGREGTSVWLLREYIIRRYHSEAQMQAITIVFKLCMEFKYTFNRFLKGR